MFEVNVWLFGKPAWELEIEKKVDVKEIRAKGEELKIRLELAADILEKLEKAGWELSGTLYNVYCYSPKKYKTEEECVKALKDLGIDPEDVNIQEMDYECEDDEDDDEIDDEEKDKV